MAVVVLIAPIVRYTEPGLVVVAYGDRRGGSPSAIRSFVYRENVIIKVS